MRHNKYHRSNCEKQKLYENLYSKIMKCKMNKIYTHMHTYMCVCVYFIFFCSLNS